MDASDIISSLIALIAVVISIATLQQNRNMLEESTRPYIAVYVTETNFQNPTKYLVVKNFGQTGALITKFETNPDLILYSLSANLRPFGKIENSFLSPGQSHVCNIDFAKARSNCNVSFEIMYETKYKKYADSITLNLVAESDNLTSRASTEDKELEIISYTLQSLVERQL